MALAKMIGTNQQSIAFWETNDKPPRSEVLLPMADALGVQVEALLSADHTPARRAGPVGKVRKVFEEVSQLPRRQQQRVLEFVLPFVSQYKREDARAT
jgi:DNA-binding XRE family transcriptional regulator